MKKINKLLFLLITTTATLVSCSPEELANKTSVTDNAAASSTIDAANAFDVQTAIQVNTTESAIAKTKTSTSLTTCAIIIVDSYNYPKIITVDYGTGCTIGSITRKGKLKISVSEPIYTKGSKMTIERIDYSINGRKLEGTIDYLNTTTDAKVPQWTRTVKNGKLTELNGNVFSNSGTCTTKQTEGVDTPYYLADNVYEMTEGEHIVTNESGNTLTLTVTETLVKKYACDYISQGKLKVVGGILNGVIDYGNNECDNDYTYTHKNSVVYELKIY